MKNLFPSFCLMIVVFLNSCSSDFKVGADYKDYTVVFGLLSRNDTAHYIKITKGFYDEKQNNLLVAQNVDSLYFKNLEVKMYKLNPSLIAVDSAKLDLADLNLEGYQKDSGVFANTPNWAYKYKLPVGELLDPTKKYKIVAKNLTTGKIVYGETEVIDNSKIKVTSPTSTNNEQLDFAKVRISYTTFNWNSPSNVSFYDLYLKLGYEEKNSLNGVITYKTALIPLQKNILNNNNNSINIQIPALDFYTALQSTLSIPPSTIFRYIDTPDVVVAAAGQDLKTYIDVTNAQGGITYDQIKPYYTNMKGGEVLGLFSSRAYGYSNQVKFSKATLDSILNGSYTKSLNFIGKSSR